jgi:multidrug efflux pump
MNLSELCIRRPVFATVLSLVVLLVGLVSYQRLTVREYPNIDEPTVSVETTFRGASADVVESQVTVPLEDSLSGIDGIELLTSVSRAERSQITVKFRLNRAPDGAAADVRDRVARVRGQLPANIDEPVISKVEADAQPIIYLAFASSRHSALEVTDYADRIVKDRLQNLEGVSQVRIFGERRYAMRLWLDRARLAAYGLTPQDIEAALRRQNVEVPSGRIESTKREFTVLAETDLKTAEEFNNLIVKETPGYLVRLKDVGKAELGARDERIYARFNGQNAVALGVVKQATANPLDVSKAVRAALPQIMRELPAGMEVAVGYDSSIFIDRSIRNVFSTIGEAIALVVLVIFFFLRSLRGTLIPLVTIPISLIGAFALMWLFGFSLNTLTLLAMVLAIGLVVDDAIVMLENIARYVESGEHPFAAAIKGSKEIGFAVIAMTLTLAAVYAPIAFQTGRIGRLFAEFALTLAGAVIVSGFVALTLSPMMSSQLLKHNARHGWVYRAIEAFLEALKAGYRRALRIVTGMRVIVVLVMLSVGAFGYALFSTLPSELAPSEDRGTVIAIGIAPEGSTIDFTLDYAKRVEAIFARSPAQERYFIVIGFPVVSQMIGFVGLRDWQLRTVKQQQIVGQMAPMLFATVPGLLAFATNPPSLGQSPIDKPISFVLQTSAPYAELERAVNQLMAAARRNPGSRSRSTARRRPISASRSRPSGARSRPCSAAGR